MDKLHDHKFFPQKGSLYSRFRNVIAAGITPLLLWLPGSLFVLSEFISSSLKSLSMYKICCNLCNVTKLNNAQQII